MRRLVPAVVAQPQAPAMPFAPVAVAAQIDTPDSRVAVIACGKRLDKFFVRRHENRVGEVGNDHGDFPVGEFFICGLFENRFRVLRPLIEDPFGRLPSLRIPRCRDAHYARIKRQTLLGETLDCIIDGLPVVLTLFGLEVAPPEAQIPSAEVYVVESVAFLQAPLPTLSGIRKDIGVFGESRLRFKARRARAEQKR